MIPASYRLYEVVREPNSAHIADVNNAVWDLTDTFRGDPYFTDLRRSNTKGYLTLLGMSKMNNAVSHATAGSRLSVNTEVTLAEIARELVHTCVQPIELPITSFTLASEPNRDIGDIQAVFFANIGSKEDATAIGQNQAAKLLQKMVGNYRIWPYPQRIPLFFANKILLDRKDPGAVEAQNELFETANTIVRGIGKIAYSGAKYSLPAR